MVIIMIFIIIATIFPLAKTEEVPGGVENVTAGSGVHWEGDSKYQHDLIAFLFGSEDSKYRHYIKPPGQLHVNISVSLNRIIELNEKSQVLTVVMWVRLNWIDGNLYWNPKTEDFGGVSVIRIPAGLIWEPDLTLWENVDDEYRELLAAPTVLVTNEGHVTWIEPRVYRTICALNIKVYPFDVHLCKFTFGSWTYIDDDLLLEPVHPAADISNFFPNNVWELEYFSEKETMAEREGSHGSMDRYSTVTYFLQFKRRWILPFVYLIVPTVLINVMCIFNFIMPAESNEKIGLSITIFLSLIVYLLLLQQLLPFAEEVPLLVVFILLTIVSVTVSLFASVIVLSIHHSGTHDNHVRAPQWARDVFLHTLAPWVGFAESITPEEEHEAKMNFNVETVEIPPEEEDVVVNPHIETEAERRQSDGILAEEAKYMQDRTGHLKHSLLVLPTDVSQNPTSARSHISRATSVIHRQDLKENQDLLLYKILKHCEFFKESLVTRAIAHSIQVEWRQIAMVIDRLLFIFYLLFTLGVWYYMLFFILFPDNNHDET